MHPKQILLNQIQNGRHAAIIVFIMHNILKHD